MNSSLTTIAGFGFGVASMYALDPRLGGRRRAVLRDKAVRLAHEGREALDVGSRDLLHRAKGVVAATVSRVKPDHPSDQVLEARVRAKIGRAISHPSAIEVHARDGVVTLQGPVLENEIKRLLAYVNRVRGVKEIENRLDCHKHPGRLPSLQGLGRQARTGERPDFLQTSWAPGTRLVLGLGGGALGVWGFARRDWLGYALAGVGTMLMIRSLSNQQLKQGFGLVARPPGIRFHKTVSIQVSIEQAYRFWANFENFPLFMQNVKEVRMKRDGRSHWTVSGPFGAPVSWDAEVTRMIPGKIIAWRSIPGSVVENAGRVRFFDNGRGGTKIEVDFTYHPPSGAVVHALSRLFGADPRHQLDLAMVQMKNYLEQGAVPRTLAA